MSWCAWHLSCAARRDQACATATPSWWSMAALALVAGFGSAVAAHSQTLDAHVGAIVVATPEHAASKEYGAGILPYLHVDALRIGELKVGSQDQGLFLAPAFGYVSEHRGVGAVYEAGVRVGYRIADVRPWIEARQQFGGAHGVAGRAGIDIIAGFFGGRIEAGPRVWFADREATQVDFASASAGISAVGTGALARLPINGTISLLGSAEWKHYTGAAARIIDTRNDAQDDFTVGLGLAYRVRID